MAQSDRFYFWRGYYDALAMLPTAEQRDALVMGICAYAFDGIEPDFGDDGMLLMGWAILRDQVRESVEIGRDASRRGSLGGRPKTSAKSSAKTSALSTAKTTAKTSALSSAKSCAKSSAESCAESEGKGRERKCTDLATSAPAPVAGDASLSAVAERRTPIVTEEGLVIPPMPAGYR